MTPEEAKEVIAILCRADGGCEHCASNLINLFLRKFPNFEREVQAVYKVVFDSTFEKENRNE